MSTNPTRRRPAILAPQEKQANLTGPAQFGGTFTPLAAPARISEELRDRVEAHFRDVLNIDPTSDTEEGRAAAFAIDVCLEFRQRVNRERAYDGLAKKRQQGRAVNGHAGYGFRLVGPKGRRRKVRDAVEQKAMADIHSWRSEGLTWEAIYFCLLRAGVRNRGREWSLSRIRRAYEAERRRRSLEGDQ